MSLADQRIVDAHIHMWDLEANHYPWLVDLAHPSPVKDRARLQRNYVLTDLFADIGELNVVAAVHVQAQHDRADTVRETRWLQGLADGPSSHGFPQAIVADTDFAASNAAEILEQHAAFPNVRGIRHAVHRRLQENPPYDPLEDPVWRRNFALLEKFGLSFDLQAFPEQIEGAARLIRQNPGVQFILTHAGMPVRSDPEGMVLWRDAVTRYAQFPNVAVKISGFGSHDPDWSAGSIAPLVEYVIEAFGISRCCLASNYPVESLAKPYGEVWRIFDEVFARFSQAERDALFWRNGARLYRIEVTEAR